MRHHFNKVPYVKAKQMFGYRGVILHVDLRKLSVRRLLTEKYRHWGGGHGLGSALFWDLCKDKTITDGRDPRYEGFHQ